MKSYIQILGSETGDSKASILVAFDFQRYIFNVGEGSQRFCLENKVRLPKVQNVFVTRVDWERCGGMPGEYFW
jgi:ribonuclease Z